MNMSRYRATFAVISALAMLSLATSSLAQQKAAPAAQQIPGLSQQQPQATPAPVAPPVQAPAPSLAAPSVPAAAASDATAAPAQAGRPPKTASGTLGRVSPLWMVLL